MKSKAFSIISTIILSIEVTLCLTIKSLYYIEKFFPNKFVAILWAVVSIMITLAPSLLIMVENIILITISKNKPFSFFLSVPATLGCVLLVLSIIFEIISLFGSAMCLDDNWSNVAVKMMIFHLSTIIPLVFTFISISLRKKYF